MNQLVVAKYKEDVTWLQQVDGYDIVVYDKGTEDPSYKILPNIGREAHTYMHHIVDQYANLSQYEYVVFTQADPFPHNKNFVNTLKQSFTSDFEPLSDLVYTCDNMGLPHHGIWNLGGICYTVGLESPIDYQFTFAVGAIFAVKSETILSKPLSYYEKCLSYIMEHDASPWQFERLWMYIFTNNLRNDE